MDRRRELLPARRHLLLQIRHPLLRARRVLVRLSGVKGLGGRRRAQFARLCGRLACVSNRRLARRSERRPLQIPALDRRGEQLARGAAGGVGGVGGVGSSGGSGDIGGGLLIRTSAAARARSARPSTSASCSAMRSRRASSVSQRAVASTAAIAAALAAAAGSASRDLLAALIRIWSGRRSLRRARRQLPSSSEDEKANGAHAQVA